MNILRQQMNRGIGLSAITDAICSYGLVLKTNQRPAFQDRTPVARNEL